MLPSAPRSASWETHSREHPSRRAASPGRTHRSLNHTSSRVCTSASIRATSQRVKPLDSRLPGTTVPGTAVSPIAAAERSCLELQEPSHGHQPAPPHGYRRDMPTSDVPLRRPPRDAERPGELGNREHVSLVPQAVHVESHPLSRCIVLVPPRVVQSRRGSRTLPLTR